MGRSPRHSPSQPPAPAPSAPAPAASAAAAAAPNTITQAVPVATAVAAASTSEPPTQQPLGFSFATPVNGPSHTPQFPNFSPLFNYSGPPSAAQTPVVGANFQAQPHAPQAIRRSPRLEALRGPNQNASQNIFSPSSFFSAPNNAPAEPVESAPLEMPPPITSSMSAIGRYQKQVHETTQSTADVENSMKELRSMARSGETAMHMLGSGSTMMKPPSPMRYGQGAPVPFGDANAAPIFRAAASGGKAAKGHNKERMNPLGIRPGSGSSCHQCKNRRDVDQLNWCANKRRTEEEKKMKKKICRKKYCFSCLDKFHYADSPRTPEEARTWICPACRGICVCAACKRRRNIGDNIQKSHSPVFSFAQRIFSDPQFMGGVTSAPESDS